MCALVLLVCHQLALLSGLTHYVQHAPRTSFVSANKEGLISLPGYLALALAGSAASAPLLSTPGVGARLLLLLAAALWAAAAVADAAVGARGGAQRGVPTRDRLEHAQTPLRPAHLLLVELRAAALEAEVAAELV